MSLILLFACLSHEDFHARERASSHLLHLVSRHPADFGPAILRLAAASTCPEARSRSRPIANCYAQWRITSYVPSSVPVWPCCDMYPTANPLVPFGLAPDVRDRCFGLRHLCVRSAEPHLDTGPYWHRHRAATEALVREKFRGGATHAEVDALLARMWAIENEYASDCAARWPESARWKQWQGGYPRP